MGNSISRKLWPSLTSSLNTAAGFPPTIQGHAEFLEEVDEKGFSWMVFIVAASGFLTDSYNLFASNVILPALSFVYWNGAGSTLPFAFNLVTLLASAIGQVVFGFAADMYGRKSLYGIELMIVIVSTIGLLQCSEGYMDPNDPTKHTWSFTVWLLFWRIIMGFGIGAEYPLSACIAAEWSSTRSRGRMMSAVFLMQPIGQLCAYGAGLTALRAFSGDSKVEMDKFWRYVIGVGVAPTLIAITFRLFMPESGRYEFDVIQSRHSRTSRASSNGSASEGASYTHDEKIALAKGIWRQFRIAEIRQYFAEDRQRLKSFAGVCLAWFFLDIAFYGLGFNSPGTLAKLWAGGHITLPANDTAPYWLANSDVDPSNYTVTLMNTTIQTLVAGESFPRDVFATPLIRAVLEQNILHAIYTVSIASICGCLVTIALINRVFRKDILIGSFVLLAAILFAAFGSFAALFHQAQTHVVLIVFWVLISFLFNVGPNTLTFIIPAEIFPTEYRCTFYGIAAASGKVGAVVAQAMVYGVNTSANRAMDGGGSNSSSLRWLLLAFAICMLAGAAFSLLLPDVQDRAGSRLQAIANYSLEYLCLTEWQKSQVPKENMESKEVIKELIKTRNLREDAAVT